MKKYLGIEGPVFIDLFAGCGGLSLGLEQAGFTPLFVNELNHDAMETYLINRRAEYPWLEENREYDIKKLVATKGRLDDLKQQLKEQFGVDDIDLVVGGPPCQGYSGIGHRRSYSVDKEQLPSNTLYEDMVRVVYKMRPKIFLFENVRGLLSARWTKQGEKGEIWRDVKGTFEDALPDYHIRAELVYAKDYGVPQNRPRILMVGVRKDLGIEPSEGLVADGYLPEPMGGYPDIRTLLGDLIEEPYPPGGETGEYKRPAEKGTIQEYFRYDPETRETKDIGATLTEQEYSNHRDHIVKKFRHMIKFKGEIPEEMQTKKFAQRWLPPTWGDNGPTITATSLPDDYVHYCQPRCLTVREWARLQMFPDYYQFWGKRTTGGLRRAGNPQEGLHDREVPKYTQIGNAVPVKLAFEVGRHFKDRLLGYQSEPSLKYG
jgi:DNA (cytosine-5)-methyltransferase 1